MNDKNSISGSPVSLNYLVKRFWKRTSLTWVLVLLEGVALVIMPMVIGWAVDDLMNKSLSGVFKLGGLCLFLLFVGAGRRFYDTRAYAKIYHMVANELVKQEQGRNSGLSKISARTNLFREFISFLEDSIPGILQQGVNLVGTLIIVAFIDFRVFVACMITTTISMIIYSLSEKKIYRLNKGGNDEIEKQIDILTTKNEATICSHFTNLMDWRIKLSDLETLNFSFIWLALAGVLLFTVVSVTSSGNLSFGQIVSAVMYVFGFIESIMAFPLYYQQMIRLQEIASRLGRS